jgi:hypothetical protein
MGYRRRESSGLDVGEGPGGKGRPDGFLSGWKGTHRVRGRG